MFGMSGVICQRFEYYYVCVFESDAFYSVVCLQKRECLLRADDVVSDVFVDVFHACVDFLGSKSP